MPFLRASTHTPSSPSTPSTTTSRAPSPSASSTALVLYTPRVARDTTSPRTSTTLALNTPTTSRAPSPSVNTTGSSCSSSTVVYTPTSSEVSSNPAPLPSFATPIQLAGMAGMPPSPVSIPESEPKGKAAEMEMLGAYLCHKGPHPPANVFSQLVEDTGLSESQVLAFWQLEWLRTKWGADIWDTLDIHCKNNQRFVHNGRAMEEFASKTRIDVRYIREFTTLKKKYDDPVTPRIMESSPPAVGSSGTKPGEYEYGNYSTVGGGSSSVQEGLAYGRGEHVDGVYSEVNMSSSPAPMSNHSNDGNPPGAASMHSDDHSTVRGVSRYESG